MITVSDRSKNLLSAGMGAYAVLFLVIFDLDNTAIYATSSHFDDYEMPEATRTALNLPGAGDLIFTADGTLKSLEPPRMTSSVDRETYKIESTDLRLSLLAENSWGLTGRFATVLAVFTDDGSIPTSADEFLTVYRGKTTAVVTRMSCGEFGELIVQISLGSPMQALDRKNGRYFSSPRVRAHNELDRCADSVYVNSRGAVAAWGRG
jgi:hypothetical protein